MKPYLFVLTLLMFANVSAMAFQVKGRISIKETGEALTGAVVRIEGRAHRALSGLDGSFVIRDIAGGEYTIAISMVGYATEVRTMKVESDMTLDEIEMKAVALEMSAITLSASRDKTSDAAARNLERAADRVINLVSARAIEVSPDLTVANVIQRVSGITVERNHTGDGQYALLRGMDKRYSYTLINGVKIPSPDNKNRFVPLDIFPAEMLSRLEVVKSLTPDMEGDGIGGAVNLVMKDAPDKLQVSANIATGFNTLFFDRPFYSFDKSQIQTQSPFELIGSQYPAKPRDFNKRLLDMQKMAFKPNLYGGLSLGNRFLKNKLGVLLAGTYQNSLRGNNSTDFPYTTATSDASNLPVITKVNYRIFSEEQTRAGLHAKLDYQVSKKHKIQWYNAWMDFKTWQVRDERKIDFSVGYNPDNKSYNLGYDRRFRFAHQQIINSTLKGEHTFTDRFNLDWSAVYSKAKNEVPDNSSVHLATTATNGVENPRSVVVLGGAERRWEHNSDEDKAGYLNIRYKVGNGKNPAILSIGGMYRDKHRNNFFKEYKFRPYDESKTAGSETNLIEGVDWNKYSEIKFALFNPLGSTGDPLNYGASEKITAGYLQGKLHVANTEIVTGVRVEHTNQGYLLLHAVAGLPNEGNQQYTDILPSINLKYALTDKSNLRASYYKAINRPSFFEIVPYRIVNEELTEAGNPDLKHTTAHNADIRYEIYPRKSEQIMMGAFYKKILNPIEFGMVLQGQGSFYMPTNFGNATNYGIELDYTKYIYYFGVKLNYTYTHSTITTSKLYYYANPDHNATDRVLLKNVDQQRRLAGQAAHVANFTLLYKNVQQGVDAQISLSYTGDRLFAVSRYLDNDAWQGGFVQLDASAEKQFSRRYVLFAKASNLLNTPLKQFVKKVNAANEKVLGYEVYKNGTLIREDRYGQTILIGFRFKM